MSGMYLVKLLSAAGDMRYMIFVVRSDASRAAILVTIPTLTYQAYNGFGGYSLYTGPAPSGGASASTPPPETSAGRSYVVSFDRPYADASGLPDPLRFQYDIDTLRWLEREGYDLSY